MPRTVRALHLAIGVWALVLSIGTLTRAAQSPPASEFKPPPAPEQPIAYSHKPHLDQGLTCTECHATATTGDHATLPPTKTCMGCHSKVQTDSLEIKKLTAYDSRQEVVPWKRVYRLPEFVYFSHRLHFSAQPSVPCQACHGDVSEMPVMQKLRDTSMAACMDCHRQRAATVQCDACHEPR